MDTKDWDGLRAKLFAPGGVQVDVSGDGAGVFEGADVFLEMLVPTLTGTWSPCTTATCRRSR